MSVFVLKRLSGYQDDALKGLLSNYKMAIGSGRRLLLDFEMFMRGGKSGVMAHLTKKLNDIFKNPDRPITTILIQPSMADNEKLKIEIESWGLGISVKPISDIVIDSGFDLYSIYISSWEEIKGDRVNLNKKGDTISIEEAINKLKVMNCFINLFIDEPWIASGTAKSHEVINTICPDAILRVYGTESDNMDSTDWRNLKRSGYIESKYTVPIKDIIESGALKKYTVINHGVEGGVEDDAYLDEACKNSIILDQKITDAGDGYLSSILVAVNNGVQGKVDTEKMLATCAKYGWTRENGKVIALIDGYDPDANKLKISKYDSTVKVIIFKKKLAYAWDSPRAYTYVPFRDLKNTPIDVQSASRILAMPNRRHYSDDLLNRGYLYCAQGTKIDPKIIQGSDGGTTIKNNIKQFDLKFSFVKHTYKESANNEFDDKNWPIIEPVIEGLLIKSGFDLLKCNVDTDKSKIKVRATSGEIIETNDMNKSNISQKGGNDITLDASNETIQKMAVEKIHKTLEGLWQNKHDSVSRFCEKLSGFFLKKLPETWGGLGYLFILNNFDVIEPLLVSFKTFYQEKFPVNKKRFVGQGDTELWSPASSQDIDTSRYKKVEGDPKYIYEHVWVKKGEPKSEEAFRNQYLTGNNGVIQWGKNTDRGDIAIYYKNNEKQMNYILNQKDGGLFHPDLFIFYNYRGITYRFLLETKLSLSMQDGVMDKMSGMSEYMADETDECFISLFLFHEANGTFKYWDAMNEISDQTIKTFVSFDDVILDHIKSLNKSEEKNGTD